MFVLPAIVLFIAFVAYPLVRTFQVSLFDWNGLTSETQFVGLDNYRWALASPTEHRAVGNALIYAAFTIPIGIAIGLALAIVLNGPGRFRAALRAVFFVPVVMTPIVVGYVFSKVLEPTDGSLSQVLRAAHLDTLVHPWLGDPNTALATVAAVVIWGSAGFSMAVYQAALTSLPGEVVEAAQIDGASPLQVIRYVVIPLLRAAHFSLFILGVIGGIKAFDLVYALTRGGPDHATELPTTFLFSTAFDRYEQGRASALGVLIFAAALVATVLQLRLYRRGGLAR